MVNDKGKKKASRVRKCTIYTRQTHCRIVVLMTMTTDEANVDVPSEHIQVGGDSVLSMTVADIVAIVLEPLCLFNCLLLLRSCWLLIYCE